MVNTYTLALDAGTTSITAILVSNAGKIIIKESLELNQYYPRAGWVEHDAQEILKKSILLLKKLSKNKKIDCIGITNQRETSVVWNKKTGKPIHKAIVWQCRRTTKICKKLQKHNTLIKNKTGLIIDPYFSATKIRWILDEYKKINHSKLLFGTIDTWLIWNLTNQQVHATDFTNASRTLLFNIKTKNWDKKLLRIFKIPRSILPEVKNSRDNFGLWKNIPIKGVVGDQQAALFGQSATSTSEAKNTYGTGCFFLQNTGHKYIKSKNKLLTTLACNANGKPVYAIEGSVYVAGAALKWLKEEMQLINSYKELQQVKLGRNHGIILIPAFVGLGAPHWNSESRGSITGITRGTNKQDIIAATLESIAWQTHDLIKAAEQDSNKKINKIFVYGGVAINDNLMQFQADILNKTIIKTNILESTAFGAALLANPKIKKVNKEKKIFTPKMNKQYRQSLNINWDLAIKKALLK